MKYGTFKYGDGTLYGKNASLEDSVGVGDSLGKSIAISLSDSTNISEFATRQVSPLLTDSQSISEIIANTISLKISDLISINEQIYTGGEKTKNLFDALSISEQTILSYKKQIIDILLKIQPSLTSKAEFSRKFNDDISINEIQGFGWHKDLEDGIPIYSDDLYKSISKCGLTEQIYFIESIIANKGIILLKSDNLLVSENLKIVFEINRKIIDSISISELLTKSIEVSKSETFPDFFDLLNVNIAKPLFDNLPIVELVGNAITIHFSDDILITESIYSGKSLFLSDDIPINEDLLKIFGKKPSDSILTAEKTEKSIEIGFAESVSLIEQLANIATVAISDFTIISESFAKQVEFLRKIDDLVGFQENQISIIGKSLSESINLNDNVLNKIGKILIDSFNFNEANIIGIDKSISDNLHLGEAAEKKVKISFSDNLNINEQSEQELPKSQKKLLDFIGINEESEINVGVNLEETIKFAEQINVNGISVYDDDLNIAEQLKIKLENEKSDSLSVFETKTKRITKEFSENVNIIESSGGENLINLFDIIAVLEKQFNSINKNFSETFDIAEKQVKEIKFKLSDNLILNDFFISATDFYREGEDTIGIIESVNLKNTPGLSDEITITETVVYDYIKNLSESVFLKAEYYSPTHNIKRIAQKGFFRDDKQSTYLRNKSQKAYFRNTPNIIYLRQSKER